jgi:hypothetical protein
MLIGGPERTLDLETDVFACAHMARGLELDVSEIDAIVQPIEPKVEFDAQLGIYNGGCPARGIIGDWATPIKLGRDIVYGMS